MYLAARSAPVARTVEKLSHDCYLTAALLLDYKGVMI